MYKIRYADGIVKLINLRNVNAITLNKTTITITFNTVLHSGSQLLGSGSIEPHTMTETLVFPTEIEAVREFEKLGIGKNELV